jgi:hypothetical protein
MTDLVEIRESYRSRKTFDELASRWSEILNFPITASHVVLMLLEMKVINLRNYPEKHEDMMMDGRYVSCLEEMLIK